MNLLEIIEKFKNNPVEFSGAVINTNYNLTVPAITNRVTIQFEAKHNPVGEFICFNDASYDMTYTYGNGTTSNITTNTKYQDINARDVNIYRTHPQYCGTFIYSFSHEDIATTGINVSTSTMTNLVPLVTDYTITPIDPLNQTLTCSVWTFSTSITPTCTGTPTYSYKVGGVTIPDTTASFTRKTIPTECNPFNSGLSQSLETTVVCDGCTYVKTPLTFC